MLCRSVLEVNDLSIEQYNADGDSELCVLHKSRTWTRYNLFVRMHYIAVVLVAIGGIRVWCNRRR